MLLPREAAREQRSAHSLILTQPTAHFVTEYSTGCPRFAPHFRANLGLAKMDVQLHRA